MKRKARGELITDRPGVLALADGTIFRGRCFGADRGVDDPVLGEVVFNTSMFGYQEILTDPSYAGQVMCFTAPHIGNVGCNAEDVESGRVYVEGVLIRDLPRVVSNFRADRTFPQYLWENGIMGLAGIDTRELVSHLRTNGSQMGAIACGENINTSELVERARAEGSMEGKDYVKAVSCKEIYSWNELPWDLTHSVKQPGSKREIEFDKLWSRPHVVAMDCGIKYNILRLLVDVGFRVTVVPATATSAEILAQKPDGLFLSNGPGDPATLGYIVKTVSELFGKLPMFGICLGHQILGQVVGGRTYKLKFGHRGGNHPVRNNLTGKVEITVQNHGFAVDGNSISKDALVSHVNLNDQTIEGLHIPSARSFCVQYHPESSPGPHDARYLFSRFFEDVVGYREQGR
ncbi:MAG: glutamine-hydrolyzing carbamoyl-phosphate synthase small subunit [Deltaproteobacteria bacterium]|nr:glutamine-hydrolyzing carbamoyl-phosphate synthase small subunit [Deltaproteobacteria bacterium]